MLKILNIAPKGFNIGNELIISCLVELIHSISIKPTSITTIGATRKWIGGAGPTGLTSGSVHFANQFFDSIILGGGNLFENSEVDIDSSALKALQIPLAIYSVSRGKIYSRDDMLVERTDVIDDNLLTLLLEVASSSIVRDRATYNYAKDMLACEKQRKLGISYCPTLLTKELLGPAFRSKITNELPENLATISLRHPNLMNISAVRQFRVREELEKIIIILKNMGFLPIAVAHDFRDISYASSLSCSYIYANNLKDYLAILQGSQIHISYRLHSFLPCISMGIPAIKLSYDERALSMLDTIGLSDWNIDIVKSYNTSADVEAKIQQLEWLKQWRSMNLLKLQDATRAEAKKMLRLLEAATEKS